MVARAGSWRRWLRVRPYVGLIRAARRPEGGGSAAGGPLEHFHEKALSVKRAPRLSCVFSLRGCHRVWNQPGCLLSTHSLPAAPSASLGESRERKPYRRGAVLGNERGQGRNIFRHASMRTLDEPLPGLGAYWGPSSLGAAFLSTASVNEVQRLNSRPAIQPQLPGLGGVMLPQVLFRLFPRGSLVAASFFWLESNRLRTGETSLL